MSRARTTLLRAAALPLALLGALASCSLFEEPPRHTESDRALEFETYATQEPSALESRLPDEVQSALIPPLVIQPREGDDALAQRFDVTVKDAPAREFFLTLVEGTPLNLVLDPGVDGEISLALKNVTIEQVLEAAQDVYGYEHRRTSYGYQILPGGLQSRVFAVDYLNVQRKGVSQTRVSSGQVSSVGSTGTSHGQTSTSTGASELSNESDSSSTSGTSIATESTSDFWTELPLSLTAIVGSGAGRGVTVSPNSGLVTVRAFPSEMRAVERFLGELKRSMLREVILEAKILEVTLNDGFQSGIDYSQIAIHGNDTYRVSQAGASGLIDSGSSDFGGSFFPLDPNTVLGAGQVLHPAPGQLFGGAVVFDAVTDSFRGFMELLERQGTVRTLSNPRVSTVNNQKAVIKVGSDEFFVTGITQTTVASVTTTTQSPAIELTPFFSGIALDVTPQVAADDEIILHIHPSVSQVQDKVKTLKIGDNTQTLPLAQSTIRESDSIVHTQSGRVIVIGGLMQTREAEETAGIPILMRIPVLGWLFRQDRKTSLKTELVILLRATTTRPEDWGAIVRGTRDRFREISGEPPAAIDPTSGQPVDPGPPIRRR